VGRGSGVRRRWGSIEGKCEKGGDGRLVEEEGGGGGCGGTLLRVMGR